MCIAAHRSFGGCKHQHDFRNAILWAVLAKVTLFCTCFCSQNHSQAHLVCWPTRKQFFTPLALEVDRLDLSSSHVAFLNSLTAGVRRTYNVRWIHCRGAHISVTTVFRSRLCPLGSLSLSRVLFRCLIVHAPRKARV